MVSRVLRDAESLLDGETLTSSGLLKFPANFAILKYKNSDDAAQHQILLEHFSKAESLLQDGSKELVKMLAESSTQKLDDTFLFRRFNSLPENSNLEGHSQDLLDLCWSAFALVGPSGKISVEKSVSGRRGLEVKVGSDFNLVSPSGNFSFNNSHVLIIDGFLESSSELEPIFLEACELKVPIVIVCRGASNDVLHTAAVNLKRGAFQLRILICKFDENGINSLRDLSIVTGSSVVTSDTGTLISSARASDTPIVDRVTFVDGTFNVEVKDSESRLKLHTDSLLKKMEESLDSINSDLVRSRVVSLNQQRCILYLEDSLDYRVRRMEVDRILKKISSLFKKGIPEKEEAYRRCVLDQLLSSCSDALEASIV